MTPQQKGMQQEVSVSQTDRRFRKRVLVFSPDADLARYLVVSLENDLTIERCTDLEYFVKSLESARPDIVLLDLSAFPSDVEQQIDALKRLDPTTPVIVLRAYVSLPKAVSDAIVGLADIVFYKPVEVDMVSKAIEDLLRVS
jgi:DNA-binding NtrC family response regulator